MSFEQPYIGRVMVTMNLATAKRPRADRLSYDECADMIQDATRARVQCVVCRFWVPFSSVIGTWDGLECYDRFECFRRSRA